MSVNGNFKISLGAGTQLTGVASITGLGDKSETLQIPSDKSRNVYDVYVIPAPPETITIKMQLFAGGTDNHSQLVKLEKAHRVNNPKDPNTFTTADITLYSDSDLEKELFHWTVGGAKLHSLMLGDLEQDGKKRLEVEFKLTPGSSGFQDKGGNPPTVQQN
jgi:hypothetical protein